ncbi:MAG: ornithine carbamoyltransferase [Mariniblastus sp.]|nr:ornithine carbamoyltransferase [Mariniblastus sp.]
MRHVLSLFDLSSSEIRRVLEIASDLKQQYAEGIRPASLERQVLGLLFEKPSMRTRVSFETLIRHAGGSSLFLGSDVGWGTREPIQDFIPIMTSYLDCLVIRANRHEDVVAATEYSRCPIINGLTDYCHPCQALADILTIEELLGSLENAKVTYVGDANNVAFSLALACQQLDVPMTIAAPERYQFNDDTLAQLNSVGEGNGLQQTSDLNAAVDGANIIYTDVWTSMGQEAESAQRVADLADYQVNRELMARAAVGARFLHCLPARRGEEVTGEVIDSRASAVIQQAENRLHAQKGLVVWLLTEAGGDP